MKRIRSILVAAVILVTGAASAAANTIAPSFTGITDLGDGTYRWNYEAYVTNGRLDADAAATEEFFTLYDIRGYVAGSATASGGWTASDHLLGKTPTNFLLTTPDSPFLLNVSFTYSSTTEIKCNAPCLVGTFSFRSTLNRITLGNWTSQDLAQNSNATQDAEGLIELPSLPDGGSTMAFLGLGLIVLGTLRWKIPL
jgi:hypothetical protein